MSMLCSLFRLNKEQAALANQNPELLEHLLVGAPAPKKPSFFARLFGNNRKENKPVVSIEPLSEESRFDLDQAWHVLHFLFTGKNEGGDLPASFIMSGGEELGPDQGYGPVRYFSPPVTATLAKYLSNLKLPEFERGYDAQRIAAAQIYWEVEEEAEERQRQVIELWELTQQLRDFVSDTAKRNESLLIDIY